MYHVQVFRVDPYLIFQFRVVVGNLIIVLVKLNEAVAKSANTVLQVFLVFANYYSGVCCACFQSGNNVIVVVTWPIIILISGPI